MLSLFQVGGESLHDLLYELSNIMKLESLGTTQRGEHVAVPIICLENQWAMTFIRPDDDESPYQLCVLIDGKKWRTDGKMHAHLLRLTDRSKSC